MGAKNMIFQKILSWQKCFVLVSLQSSPLLAGFPKCVLIKSHHKCFLLVSLQITSQSVCSSPV